MDRGLVAKVSERINAPIAEVWDALVNPNTIKRYMLGTDVSSDWRKGSPIVWRGVWEGRAYEDRGKILEIRPWQLIRYTHFSPLSELEDIPENHQTVSVDLSSDGRSTLVSLSQDNNPTEEARDHSEKNWSLILAGMKKLLEE